MGTVDNGPTLNGKAHRFGCSARTVPSRSVTLRFSAIKFMATVLRGIAVALALPALTAATSCGDRSLPGGPSQVPAGAIGRIVVLGDSLAVSPTIAEGFPARLQGLLDAARYRWTVSNAGVWGDTTRDGLSRFDAAVPAGTHILVLELGANDGLQEVDIATIERNLAQMMERARAMRLQVLLCGMETPPLHGLDYTVRFHQVFARLAARYDVPLVPFLLSGVALHPNLNVADGIHPNAAGAQRIAETVWPYLEPLVRAGMRTEVGSLMPIVLGSAHAQPARLVGRPRDHDALDRLRRQPRPADSCVTRQQSSATAERHPAA